MKRWLIDADARNDLLQIYDHVAGDNPRAADSLIDLFCEKFLLLANHPMMGQARPELFPDLRSFSVKSYVIFYRPRKDGVQIVRIIHSARDIDAFF